MPSLADLSRAGVGRPQSPPSHLATLSRAALNAVPVAGAVAPSVEEVLNLRNVDWARWAKEGLPAQILNAAVSGLTLPRDVATGAVDYNTDPDQVIGRAAELAGILELGGMPFAQKNALGMFGGRLAKTADHSKLAKAQRMAAEGVDKTDIWNETGWFKGVDDAWRFEIDDSAAKFMGPNTVHDEPISALLKHDPLYAAYPDAANIPSEQAYPSTLGGSRAQYLNGGGVEKINYQSGMRPENSQSALLHELQHGVQRREGFAVGGNTANSADEFLSGVNNELSSVAKAISSKQSELGLGGYRPQHPDLDLLYRQYDGLMDARSAETSPQRMHELYKRIAGEAEARNVQTRMDMTPAQRRATPPWETQDIPDADQIVRFRDGGVQQSVNVADDLPMDEASRMARAEEMGFDVDAYKGSTPRDWRTGDEIDSFRATGLDEDVKDAFRGYVGADGGYAGFFSDDPNVANRFAEAFDPSGAVYPVKLKFNNPLVFDATNQRSRNFQFTEHAAREGLDIEHREIKRVLDGDSDHDGVILQNTEDEGTVYIPAGSHQVRSRFAKFDPAKKDSSNLLAGITGAGLGAGALSALADYDTPR